jgi:hypothetical protein
MDQLLEAIKEKVLILKELKIKKEQLAQQHKEILIKKEELEFEQDEIESEHQSLRENIDRQIDEISKLDEIKNEVINFKQFANYMKKKNLIGMAIVMAMVALISLPAILSSITAYLSIIMAAMVIISSCYIPYYFTQTKYRRKLKKMINLDNLLKETEKRLELKEELEKNLLNLKKNNNQIKKDVKENAEQESNLDNELLYIEIEKNELYKDIEQLLFMLVSNGEISEMEYENNMQDNSETNLGSCKRISLQ